MKDTCLRSGFHLNFTWLFELVASESSLSMSVIRMELPLGSSGEMMSLKRLINIPRCIIDMFLTT